MGKLMKAELYKLQQLTSVRMIFLFSFAVGILRGFSPYSGYQVYNIGLVPELFDIVLISVFTAAFLCTEFSQRTFGNACLCGAPRQNVFLAKLAVFFFGLLVFILLPLLVSTSIATVKNGFGVGWDAVTMEIVVKFLFYIFHRFSMAGFAILIAAIIHKPIGMLGISVAGIYLMSLSQNSVVNPFSQETWISTVIKTIIFLFGAAFIFIKRDLK